MSRDVDYDRAPAEDFASMTIEFKTADGHKVIGEATTSWSFVGAGLRLSAELRRGHLQGHRRDLRRLWL